MFHNRASRWRVWGQSVSQRSEGPGQTGRRRFAPTGECVETKNEVDDVLFAQESLRLPAVGGLESEGQSTVLRMGLAVMEFGTRWGGDEEAARNGTSSRDTPKPARPWR